MSHSFGIGQIILNSRLRKALNDVKLLKYVQKKHNPDSAIVFASHTRTHKDGVNKYPTFVARNFRIQIKLKFCLPKYHVKQRSVSFMKGI